MRVPAARHKAINHHGNAINIHQNTINFHQKPINLHRKAINFIRFAFYQDDSAQCLLIASCTHLSQLLFALESLLQVGDDGLVLGLELAQLLDFLFLVAEVRRQVVEALLDALLLLAQLKHVTSRVTCVCVCKQS